MILCEWDMLPRAKYKLHHCSVSCYLLLIACSELSDLELCEEYLDFSVGKLAPLDACGWSDTLDSCYASQWSETLRCECPECTPSTLEFIDLSYQCKYIGRDNECIEYEHIHIYIQLYPICNGKCRTISFLIPIKIPNYTQFRILHSPHPHRHEDPIHRDDIGSCSEHHSMFSCTL